jgi:prepilin-type N-terminal cleavage/methylation domain-containing protein
MRELCQKGFTLFETMISIVLLTVLAGVLAILFHAMLLNWNSAETRSGLNIPLNRGIEEIAQDLRKAKQIQSTNDEIRFTQDNNTFFIYYFYNAGDSYPLVFNQSSYTIQKAALSGGLGSSFSFGSGPVILTNVLPPPASDLSLSGNMLTVDVSVSRLDETIRSRTEIRPRNL